MGGDEGGEMMTEQKKRRRRWTNVRDWGQQRRETLRRERRTAYQDFHSSENESFLYVCTCFES